jgi:hypothetical protein
LPARSIFSVANRHTLADRQNEKNQLNRSATLDRQGWVRPWSQPTSA